MGSLTNEQRQAEEVIKRKLMEMHSRGVCNRDGQTVKDKDGNPRPAMTFAQKQALKQRRRR